MATIKDKIKKLLSLASSSNENEAKAALLKAKELMAKNKLTEEDFEESGNYELKRFVCDNISWTTDSGKIWMVKLCDILCNNYCCSASWNVAKGSRTYKLVIVGLGEDAEICKEVVEYAVGFVENTIKCLHRKYRREDPKSISNSYADGFILGLELAFEDQREEHPEWGLVVVKPKEVSKYENNLRSKSVKTKETGFSPLAYLKGQTDGKNFSAQKVLPNCQ